MKVKHGYYDVFVRTCARSPSNIAVRHFHDGVYKTYTYSELYGVCEYISQNMQQLQCSKGIIGLVSERNVIIPCVIAAAHKCSTTFMFLDPTQDIETLTKEVKFKMVITIKDKDTRTSELFNKEPDKTVDVFDLTIKFYNFEYELSSHHIPEHSFITMTSGSTGHPKHIQVPIQCIQPNVDDLTKLFDITAKDIIYFSTPLTFDPSMIEILLACINGASLLIAPEKADILFPNNPKNSITFWQVTPSRFFQYSNADIRNKILGPNSTLRILALGGEPLNGVKTLKELKHWENRTKIFTLYGVSEMSCWACVAHLDLSRVLTDKEVPLGDCLSETQIQVEPDKENKNTGKILLVSKSRKCIILNSSQGAEEENSLRFIDTGDLGEMKNGTIYYRGRIDDVIKRFGHKINLQYIEATIMQCPRIKTCSCVWLPKPKLLVVYFSSETMTSQELSDFLKCKLDDKHWPDKILKVDNLPTNPHGKISKLIVSKMYENIVKLPQTSSSLRANFLKEVQSALSSSLIYNDIKNKDFFSIGGTSFLAVTMCNKLSQTCPKFGKLILPHLITQRKSIEEIIQIAEKEICVPDRKVQKRTKRSTSDATSHVTPSQSNKKPCLEDIGNPVEFIVPWTYDTGKCVDASPILYQTPLNLYVIVGSHSGKIIVMDAISGILQGVLAIEARVEAAVLCFQPESAPARAVVGAYDGSIICFSLESCKEEWRLRTDSMIKSRAVWCKNLIYVASYDGKIRCIDMMTGELIDSIDIASQAISADLVLAKQQFVLAGALSGECACVRAGGGVAWRGACASPVFAAPALYDADKYVVFAEVNGEIHCRTVEKGIKIWKYQGAKGNIFSSFYIREVDKLKWQIVFGCHDRNVYSIIIKNFQPMLSWKTEFPAPVYSTPCSLGDKLVLAASNNGKLCALEADSGVIVAEHNLPNETFSSPAVYGDYIYIGCRDDNLYCLKYVVNL